MGGGSSSTTTTQRTVERDPQTPEEASQLREQTALASEQRRQAQASADILDITFPVSVEFAEQQLSAVSKVIHDLFGVGTGGAVRTSDEFRALDLQISKLRGLRDAEVARGVAPREIEKELRDLEATRRSLITEGRAITQEAAGELTPNQQLAQTLDQVMQDFATGDRPLVSDDIRDEVDALFDRELEKGNKFLIESAEEQAAQRGLRLTDSPIFRDLVREQGNLARDIATAKVQTAITLGEATRQFLGAQQQFQKTSDLSALGILSGVPVQPSATTFAQLSGGAASAGLGLLGLQQREREPAGILTTQRSEKSGGFLDVLTGVGRLASGAGAIGRGFF